MPETILYHSAHSFFHLYNVCPFRLLRIGLTLISHVSNFKDNTYISYMGTLSVFSLSKLGMVNNTFIARHCSAIFLQVFSVLSQYSWIRLTSNYSHRSLSFFLSLSLFWLVFLFVFFVFVCVWGSLFNSCGCPRTCFVDKSGLKLRDQETNEAVSEYVDDSNTLEFLETDKNQTNGPYMGQTEERKTLSLTTYNIL